MQFKKALNLRHLLMVLTVLGYLITSVQPAYAASSSGNSEAVTTYRCVIGTGIAYVDLTKHTGNAMWFMIEKPRTQKPASGPTLSYVDTNGKVVTVVLPATKWFYAAMGGIYSGWTYLIDLDVYTVFVTNQPCSPQVVYLNDYDHAGITSNALVNATVGAAVTTVRRNQTFIAYYAGTKKILIANWQPKTSLIPSALKPNLLEMPLTCNGDRTARFCYKVLPKQGVYVKTNQGFNNTVWINRSLMGTIYQQTVKSSTGGTPWTGYYWYLFP